MAALGEQSMSYGALIVGLVSVLSMALQGAALRGADFDSDGYADLAVGVWGEDIGDIEDAGAVNVLYGASDGITATGDQIWDQNDLASTDVSEEGDLFGHCLAAGDLNGDGAVDLAVGIYLEDIGAAADAGAVQVLYGVPSSGLAATDNQFWHQLSPGVEGDVEVFDQFGRALAIGDFDGDGYDDLAVGVPHESIGAIVAAGAVNVLYGTASGLSSAGDQMWYEGHNGLLGIPEQLDKLGHSLTSGDFDGDGYDDLAIGSPDESLGGVSGAGRVVVLYGTSGGLSAMDSQYWVQGENGILDGYESNDYFGTELASGDFNGDGYSDLAIGTPEEDSSSLEGTGAVNVIYGSSNGLTAVGNQVSYDVLHEAGDKFGWSLATGDFNGDGFDELAVGIPWDNLGTLEDTGAVEVLYGYPGGLYRRVDNYDLWHQDRAGMEDGAHEGDQFGRALAAGDFNADGYVDLAVGIPKEDASDIDDTGAIHILYGSTDGISATNNRIWHQDIPGVDGEAEYADEFGISLIALPLTHLIFSCGFETGNTSRWSDTTP